MKYTNRFILSVALMLPIALSSASYAQVPLDCSGADCGAVQIPENNPDQGVELPDNNDFPPAGEAGMAPGEPIESDASE